MIKLKTPKIIKDLLKNKEYSTPIKIFFATKTFEEGYDTFENNFNTTILNPITIHGKVTEVAPEKLYFKTYGKGVTNAVEIITFDKYKNYFVNANKIEINDVEYAVWRDAGGQVGIIKRSFGLIRVTLARK
jgi:hypothetical protein